MHAGESGITLEIETGLSLAGCQSVRLLLKPPGPQPAVLRTIDPTPASGTLVEYVTQAADFPSPGLYLLMLEARFNGKLLKSSIASLELERPLVAETDS